ncbi:MAG: hypothetical protein AABW91_03130 [Nanoarchaeota archaeon]
MKKIVFLFLVLILLFSVFFLSISFVSSFSTDPGKIIEGVTGVDDPGKLNPGNIQSSAEVKWQYLKEEWKKILLGNKAVAFFDNLFKKINPVFLFLFNHKYDLFSFEMWAIIFIWIFSAAFFVNIFRLLSLKIPLSIVLAVSVSIILAQLDMFSIFYDRIAGIVNSQQSWVTRLIAWIFIILVLFIAYFFMYSLLKMYEGFNKVAEDKRMKKDFQKMRKILLSKKKS